MSTLNSNGRAQQLLARMAADYTPHYHSWSTHPRAAAMRVGRANHLPLRSLPSCIHHRRFATSPPSPSPSSTSHSTSSSTPPTQRSPFTPPPPTPPPNPHLSPTDLSPSQLDTILRTEKSRRTTVQSKQEHLSQLLQQLEHETAHDEAEAALTGWQRLRRGLAVNQRGVKLLALLLAITSLAASMQLLVTRDRLQLSGAAARQRLEASKEAVGREEVALDELLRRVKGYLGVRLAAASGVEKAWLEALQGRVAEVEAASVCSVDETKARQAVQALERDVNARYEANKRKPWW